MPDSSPAEPLLRERPPPPSTIEALVRYQGARYSPGMARNLADPSYEPSDEELQELSRAAFADVPASNEAVARQLRAEIRTLRAASLQRVRALMGRAR